MRLIDADALIEVLGLDEYNNGEGMTPTEEWIAEAIMTAPTIDAEPVRIGKWKTWAISETFTFTCRECGFPSVHEYNYCPHCGAKMEG